MVRGFWDSRALNAKPETGMWLRACHFSSRAKLNVQGASWLPPRFVPLQYPRSPGTHIVGSWLIDRISLYRDPRTGTQYIGNWASRGSSPPLGFQVVTKKGLKGAWAASYGIRI